MRNSKYIKLDIEESFLQKLNQAYDTFTYLNGNQSKHSLLAIGVKKTLSFFSFEHLNTFIKENNDWVFGCFPYDLKNEVEPQLSSNNEDFIESDELLFYIPKLVVEIKEDKQIIYYDTKEDLAYFEKEVIDKKEKKQENSKPIDIKQKVSQKTYIKNVKNIQQHILAGDIYEMNYCHEFYGITDTFNPISTYLKLNSYTQAPFSCFYKQGNTYVLCASPERFLKKEGNTILSQPIKGTAKRGKTTEEDLSIKNALEKDEKERSENIMIVDLVRNDLSKTASKGSVNVSELCKIYTFETVHQMISTVTSSIKEGYTGVDVIKNAFPMGSMTGAPKVEAMKLIEHFENSKRGIYSGAIGYFKPNGDFDFNVVIRSIIYNDKTKKCSFMVGGAITLKSDAQKEYEETLVKAEALIKALQ